MYALCPAMTRSKANCQGYYKTLLKHMGFLLYNRDAWVEQILFLQCNCCGS